MLKTTLSIMAAVLVILAGWTLLTLTWSYSEGERAGYVQKFYFTVRDEAVARRINTSVGERVALLYEEHKWIPFSCFGDTGYFVTDVRAAE